VVIKMMLDSLFFGGAELIKFVVSAIIIIVAVIFSIIKTKSKIIGILAGLVASIICMLFELLNIYTLMVILLFFGLIIGVAFSIGGTK